MSATTEATVRAIFDLRVHVEAASEQEAWELATRALHTVRVLAPPGVEARCARLRPAESARGFRATMSPGKA